MTIDKERLSLLLRHLALLLAAILFFVAMLIVRDADRRVQIAEERSDCVNNAVYYTYYVHGDDASYAQMKANLARCGTGFWNEEN